MAFASDSTVVPARPLLPLPALDRRAIGRDGWARAREIASRLGGAVPDHVAEGMRQAWAAARGLLQPSQPEESRLPDHPGNSDVVDHPNHVGALPPLLPLPAPLPSLTAALSRRRAIFGAVAVDEADTAAEARAIHARRELHQALEWGFAFLDALDLGPAALDVVDGAIARMDALDGDTDLEGEPAEDDGTGEPCLASPERHPRVPTVTWGRAYTARGGEEGQLRWAEGAQHDGELDPCDGPIDDDELDDDGLSTAEGDHADDEPTLGAPAGDGTQEHWAQGASTSNDPEGEEADAEPEEGIAALWMFGPSRREATHV